MPVRQRHHGPVGSALERLAEIDKILFDKTGTLTVNKPWLVNARIEASALEIAAALAAGSRPAGHGDRGQATGAPSLWRRCRNTVADWKDARRRRLSPPSGLGAGRGRPGGDDAGSECVLSCNGRFVARFVFEDRERAEAGSAVARLAGRGLRMEIVSGDRRAAVESLASRLGIPAPLSGLPPAGKVARIAALGATERKVLMVGDGLNDAPALSAAHVSMAPATAADIGRVAADFVFLKESLSAVPDAIEVAIESGALIRQNFAFAVAYNVVAVPFAIAGFVTPLLAAVAMSLSSLLVVANALRLSGARRGRPAARPAPAFATTRPIETAP